MENLKYIVVVVIITLFCSCKNDGEEIEIIPFTLLNEEKTSVDRGDTLYFKSEYFLIRNYHDGNDLDTMLQKFVDSHIDSTIKKYTQYDIVFYKESEITNEAHLKQRPRDLDRYSQQHDLLFDYCWRNGSFSRRYEYKNGQTKGADDIIVKDIEESSQSQ